MAGNKQRAKLMSSLLGAGAGARAEAEAAEAGEAAALQPASARRRNAATESRAAQIVVETTPTGETLFYKKGSASASTFRPAYWTYETPSEAATPAEAAPAAEDAPQLAKKKPLATSGSQENSPSSGEQEDQAFVAWQSPPAPETSPLAAPAASASGAPESLAPASEPPPSVAPASASTLAPAEPPAPLAEAPAVAQPLPAPATPAVEIVALRPEPVAVADTPTIPVARETPAAPLAEAAPSPAIETPLAAPSPVEASVAPATPVAALQERVAAAFAPPSAEPSVAAPAVSDTEALAAAIRVAMTTTPAPDMGDSTADPAKLPAAPESELAAEPEAPKPVAFAVAKAPVTAPPVSETAPAVADSVAPAAQAAPAHPPAAPPARAFGNPLRRFRATWPFARNKAAATEPANERREPIMAAAAPEPIAATAPEPMAAAAPEPMAAAAPEPMAVAESELMAVATPAPQDIPAPEPVAKTKPVQAPAAKKPTASARPPAPSAPPADEGLIDVIESVLSQARYGGAAPEPRYEKPRLVASVERIATVSEDDLIAELAQARNAKMAAQTAAARRARARQRDRMLAAASFVAVMIGSYLGYSMYRDYAYQTAVASAAAGHIDTSDGAVIQPVGNSGIASPTAPGDTADAPQEAAKKPHVRHSPVHH